MPLDYRKGLFRLWFSIWAITAFVIFLVSGWGFGGFKSVAVFSAAIWTLWTLLIWIAAGFGRVAPPNFKGLVAILLLAALVYGGGELVERQRRADLLAARTSMWQPQSEVGREVERIQEPREMERIKEQREAKRIREQMESQLRKRQEFVSTRTAEILNAYPKIAADLEIDDPLTSFPGPPQIGKDDAKRRDPETGREFLVTCAKSWIRRKCARSLANAEFERGELYDTKAEMRARAEIAERRAQVLAERKAEAAIEQARLAREREEKAILDDLYPLYAGSENQRWCVNNHGVEFGPEDFVRQKMQRECRRVREKNQP